MNCGYPECPWIQSIDLGVGIRTVPLLQPGTIHWNTSPCVWSWRYSLWEGSVQIHLLPKRLDRRGVQMGWGADQELVWEWSIPRGLSLFMWVVMLFWMKVNRVKSIWNLYSVYIQKKTSAFFWFFFLVFLCFFCIHWFILYCIQGASELFLNASHEPNFSPSHHSTNG